MLAYVCVVLMSCCRGQMFSSATFSIWWCMSSPIWIALMGQQGIGKVSEPVATHTSSRVGAAVCVQPCVWSIEVRSKLFDS